MTARRSPGLTWALLALVVALLGGALVLAALSGFPRASIWGSGAVIVTFCVLGISSASIGVLIASREPRNAVAWVCVGIGAGVGASTLLSYYVYYAVRADPGGLPAGTLLAPLADWAWLVWMVPLLVHLVLLFPDGRLPSPRWRVVAWLGGLAPALAGVSQALLPQSPDGYPGLPNPLGVDGGRSVLEATSGIGFLVFTACILAAAVSMGLRFRRAGALERQQIKWFAYAAAGLAVIIVVGQLTFFEASDEARGALLIAADLTTVAFAAPLLATGIAILRYRLYDIDVVINRTLVYGALTAMLAGAYLSSVLLLQVVLSGVTEGSGLAVAASTLAVAGLFRPARGRIQEAVDRRFYRRKYDAQRTLEAFSSRLRDEVDLGTLSAELGAVVRETLQPAHLSLWLRAPQQRR